MQQDLVQVLMQAGYSNTRARRAVLLALDAATGPVSPAALLQAARAHHPALGLVTVYRTLEILEGLGLVTKLHLSEGCHSYVLRTAQLARPGENGSAGEWSEPVHGHHIICQECHRAVEFAGCDIDEVVRQVQAQTGYTVRSHWLEMFGLCPECLEREQ